MRRTWCPRQTPKRSAKGKKKKKKKLLSISWSSFLASQHNSWHYRAETLTWPRKGMFDRSSYKWRRNANVISQKPNWKRCNQPFLIHTTLMFKRMTTLFLIVYVIHQNCHLQPLRAPRFISKLPLVFATHPIFTSSKSAATSLTLPGDR